MHEVVVICCSLYREDAYNFDIASLIVSSCVFSTMRSSNSIFFNTNVARFCLEDCWENYVFFFFITVTSSPFEIFYPKIPNSSQKHEFEFHFFRKLFKRTGNKFLKRSKLTFFIPIHRIPNRYFIFVQNNKTRKKISRDIDSSNHCILVFRRSIFQKKLRASIIQSPIHLPIKLFKKQKKHRTSNQKLNNPLNE